MILVSYERVLAQDRSRDSSIQNIRFWFVAVLVGLTSGLKHFIRFFRSNDT